MLPPEAGFNRRPIYLEVLMTGKQIANYRIEEKIGEGGMGVVYRAIDIDLDRPVAIKVLSANLSGDQSLLERFRAEAKAQAHLNHANIASLYTLLNVDGHIGIVMEYLEGETLDQILQRRGLIPWEEAVPWFKQALLGVGFAHRRGIVHRDIKPSNIMVNGYGTVKVMDFGIAKAIGGQRLTKTGTNVGTVAYMSPEQVRNLPVDVRSDVYCLGVTLYELLTAHLPFESDSEFQVMSDHVNTPPPAPSRHYPYIPPGIEQAVLKALAKDPNDRFQSVEEFGAALEHPEGMKTPLAATVAYPSAAARSPSQSGARELYSEAVSAAKLHSSAAPSRWNNRRMLLGGGVLVAVVIAAAMGTMVLQHKPVRTAASQLGGGGEIAGAGLPGSGTGANAGQNKSNSVSVPEASNQTQTSLSGSSSPNILKALQSEKNAGESNAAAAEAATGLSRPSGRAAVKLPRSTKTKPNSQPQAIPAPVDQAPTAATPQPPPQTEPAGPSEAELNSADENLIKLRARMDAVHQSLANLKQQQAADGLGLRGDIVASESRLYSYFNMADRMLQQRNLAAAEKNMQHAEEELTKLEHFLGR